jgi:hypothetical protein
MRVEPLAKPGIGHAFDQRRRRIEHAVVASLAACHERLEGPAEHFGIDGRVGPGVGALARRHAVPAQQRADHAANRIVRERA